MSRNLHIVLKLKDFCLQYLCLDLQLGLLLFLGAAEKEPILYQVLRQRICLLAGLLICVLKDALNVLKDTESNVIAKADALLRPTDDGFVKILKYSLYFILKVHGPTDGYHEILMVQGHHIR